jgi:hypothetical protein
MCSMPKGVECPTVERFSIVRFVSKPSFAGLSLDVSSRSEICSVRYSSTTGSKTYSNGRFYFVKWMGCEFFVRCIYAYSMMRRVMTNNRLIRFQIDACYDEL